MSKLETVFAAMRAAEPLNTPAMRRIARAAGRDQALAEQLWGTGEYSARIVASLVGDPGAIARRTMDEWASDFDCWSLCDACCCNLFDRTPWAWQKVRKWAPDEREFVRRASFATIAAAAVHDKAAEDQVFLDALPLIEKYAFDGRNFVKKGVNWALRNIEKRNDRLRSAAMDCAERVHAQGTSSARWIASDALRELRRRGVRRAGSDKL